MSCLRTHRPPPIPVVSHGEQSQLRSHTSCFTTTTSHRSIRIKLWHGMQVSIDLGSVPGGQRQQQDRAEIAVFLLPPEALGEYSLTCQQVASHSCQVSLPRRDVLDGAELGRCSQHDARDILGCGQGHSQEIVSLSVRLAWHLRYLEHRSMASRPSQPTPTHARRLPPRDKRGGSGPSDR